MWLLVEAHSFSYCIFSFVLAGMHFRAKTRKNTVALSEAKKSVATKANSGAE